MEIVRVREDRLGRAHTGEVIAPLSRSGNPFFYALAHRGWRYFADSAHALLPVIIPGYPPLAGSAGVDAELEPSLEDEDSDGQGQRRRGLRLHHARGAASWRQAEILVFEEQRLGPQPEAERDVLLAAQPPVLTERWTSEVPLLLLDIDYRPYTDRPCPDGNISWIRPATADGYLLSLGLVGCIALARRP